MADTPFRVALVSSPFAYFVEEDDDMLFTEYPK